ncbi:hypothetical protein C6N75_02545 [Streptomyces solincola]|uniref:Uncharacterized protein n=1 Tax=Streptomyces solincola TaxID=2100817 RepID=A0A2S9Q285_9ACTN|nr:hypothetical protein [Streptomyces solincola]PRH80784.1 hypothetical protein C6N75_02545 [Streptomyces solincola]
MGNGNNIAGRDNTVGSGHTVGVGHTVGSGVGSQPVIPRTTTVTVSNGLNANPPDDDPNTLIGGGGQGGPGVTFSPSLIDARIDPNAFSQYTITWNQNDTSANRAQVLWESDGVLLTITTTVQADGTLDTECIADGPAYCAVASPATTNPGVFLWALNDPAQ